MLSDLAAEVALSDCAGAVVLSDLGEVVEPGAAALGGRFGAWGWGVGDDEGPVVGIIAGASSLARSACIWANPLCTNFWLAWMSLSALFWASVILASRCASSWSFAAAAASASSFASLRTVSIWSVALAEAVGSAAVTAVI